MSSSKSTSPRLYTILTKNGKLSGKTANLLKILKRAIPEFDEDNYGTYVQLFHTMHDLFIAFIITGSLNLAELFRTNEIVINLPAQRMLLNVLQIIYSNIQHNEEHVARYIELVEILKEFVDEDLLRQKVPSEIAPKTSAFPTPAGKKAANIRQLEIRSRTIARFVQDKYNLFIEECEGYAKLTTEIGEHLQEVEARRINSNDDAVFDSLNLRVSQITGQFKLDPNRVIDIILSGLENSPDDACLLRMLGQFRSDHVTTILGFVFNRSHTTTTSASETESSRKSSKRESGRSSRDRRRREDRARRNSSENNREQAHTSEANKSMVSLLAHLIRSGVVSITDVMPYLIPDNANPFEERKEFEDEQLHYADALGRVNLNETSDQRDAREKTQSQARQNAGSFEEHGEKYQVYVLLHQLLSVGDWNNAKQLLKVCAKARPECKKYIRDALLNLLEWIVRPFVKRHAAAWLCLRSNAKGITRADSLASGYVPMDGSLRVEALTDLPNVIEEIVAQLNIQLCQRPQLLCHLCRVLAVLAEQMEGLHEDVVNAMKRMIFHILSAYSLIPNNTGISEDVWRLLSNFGYEFRFQCYGHWRSQIYNQIPELQPVRAQAIKDSKHFMRRYHVDDGNQKQIARKLGKLVSCHPIIVFECILDQLLVYVGNTSFLIDGFRYLSHLDRDVLIFEILRQCEASRQLKVNLDTNYSPWFRALCEFTGSFFKNFHETDISPVIQYVIHKLRQNESDHVLLLYEVISSLTHVEAFGETVGTGQLPALAGSENLKVLAFDLDMKAKSRSMRRLVRTLIDGRMILPIFVLLSQQVKYLSTASCPEIHASLLPTLIDNTNNLFVQLALLVEIYVIRYDVVDQIPSLHELVRSFGMGPEHAFMLCRPFRGQPRITRVEQKDEDGDVDMKTDPETQKRNLDKVSRAIVPDIWHAISPRLYSTFWSLGARDIFVPRSCYRDAMDADKNNRHLRGVQEEHARRRKKHIAALQSDMEQQEDSVTHVLNGLRREFVDWFRVDPRTNEVFLHKCIIPRVFVSDVDAMFCGKFIELIVQEAVANFHVIDFVNCLMISLNQILSSSTHAEARRLGRFFTYVMAMLELFRSQEPKFAKFRASHKSAMDHEDFCTYFRTIHRDLTIHLVHLMESKQLLRQKNAVLFLSEFGDTFPKVQSHAKHLAFKVSAIETEKGTSMEILCTRVKGELNKNVDDQKYITEDRFGGRTLPQQNKKPAPNPPPKVVVSTKPAPKTAPKPAPKSPRKSVAESKETSSQLSSLRQKALASRPAASERKRSAGEALSSEESAPSRKKRKVSHTTVSDEPRESDKEEAPAPTESSRTSKSTTDSSQRKRPKRQRSEQSKDENPKVSKRRRNQE